VPVLTKPRWETFCLEYLSGKPAGESALIAGFSPKTCYSAGPRLLKKVEIRKRLAELRNPKDKPLIMAVDERKERLTEIARSKLTDFMELGQDGSWVNIGKETPNGGAIQEIHSRTEYDDDGSKPTVYTSVKLHDPLKAIDLLNKMDKLYSETIINVDNRKIEVYELTTEQLKFIASRSLTSGGGTPKEG